MKSEMRDFAIIVASLFVALVLYFAVWTPYVWPKVSGLFAKKSA